MKPTTKIRKEGTVLIVSTLILAGTPVQGIVYTPVVKKVLQSDAVYVTDKGHNPFKDQQAWIKSEARKKEIMDRIYTTRMQIRQKAKELQQQMLVDSYNEAGAIVDAITSPVKVQVSTIRQYQTTTI